MQTLIIHDIELLPETAPEDFERFVTERDYVECSYFAPLLSFTVVRVSDDGRSYQEHIHVTDMDEFEAVMKSDRFARLEQEFSGLARITGETVHTVVGHGYVAERNSAVAEGAQ